MKTCQESRSYIKCTYQKIIIIKKVRRFWVDGYAYDIKCGDFMDTCLHTCIQTHQAEHIKYEHLFVCQSYSNKVVLKILNIEI